MTRVRIAGAALLAGWPTQARFWLEWGSSRAAQWQQKFTYDPFGNIKKDATVGTSFQPTYNQKKALTIGGEKPKQTGVSHGV